MRTIKNLRSSTPLLVAATLLAALAYATPADAGDAAAGTTYVVGVEGMTCPAGCTSSVREALETVDGVDEVAVDFDTKRATVEMAPGKTLTADNCDKAFGNSGYFVSSFDEAKPDQG